MAALNAALAQRVAGGNTGALAPSFKGIDPNLLSRVRNPQAALQTFAAMQQRLNGGGTMAAARAQYPYQEAPAAKPKSGGGGGFDIGGVLGDALKGLDLAGSASRAVFSRTAGGVGNLLRERALGEKPVSGLGWDTLGKDISNHTSMGQYLSRAAGNGDTGKITGNNIADMLVGFAGDVASDPLTYVAPVKALEGGSEAIANRLLKPETVANIGEKLAAEAGTARFVAGPNGVESVAQTLGQSAAEDMASRVLRGGKRALSNDELKLAFDTTGGLKFNVPGTGRVAKAIGLTERASPLQLPLVPKTVTDLVSAPFAAAKDAAGATKIGQTVKAAFGGANPELKAAVKGGSVDALKAKTAMRTQGLAGQVYAQHALDEYGSLARNFTKDNGKDVIAAVEGSPEAAARLAAQGVDHQPLTDLLGRMAGDMKAAGVPLSERLNYFPRMVEPDAKAAMNLGQNIGDNTPFFLKQRQYVAGATLKDGTVLQGAEHQIRDTVDRWAKESGLGDHFYQNNPDQVMPAYIQAVSKRIAKQNVINQLSAAGVVKTTAALREEQVARSVQDIAPQVNAAVEHAARTPADQSLFSGLAHTDPTNLHIADNPSALTQAAQESAANLSQVRARLNGPYDMTPEAHVLLQRQESALAQRDAIMQTLATEPDLNVRRAGLIEAQSLQAEADLASAIGGSTDPQKIIAALSGEKQVHQAIQALSDGTYHTLTADASLAAPADVADALNRVAKVSTPEGMRQFLGFYDKLLNYIKTWQLASPGFLARLSLGHAFNGYLADMEVGAYHTFFQDYRAFKNGTLEGEALTNMEKISPFLGSHTGDYSRYEIEHGPANIFQKFNPASSKNLLIQGEQKAMGNIIEYMRGAMLYDTVRAGGTADEAVARMLKFHFDYTDLNNFERNVVKRVIPFYTWTRRNLPLQLEMLVERPGKFARYYQAKKEIESGTTPEGTVPSYFGEMFGIHTPIKAQGSDLYITPRLPFTEALASLPVGEKGLELNKTASMITPILKTPIERAMNHQFFKDIPFTDKKSAMPESWAVVPGLKQALQTVGVVDKKGEITDRNAYTIGQYLPVLAQTQRLAPSEKKYQARALSSWLNTLGVPLRANTPYEQKIEKFRQLIDSGKISKQSKWVRSGNQLVSVPQRKS